MAICERCGQYENDDTINFCIDCDAEMCTDCMSGHRCLDCCEDDEPEYGDDFEDDSPNTPNPESE